jgi:hypothetical protein
MAGDGFQTPGLRTAFRAEVKRSTQATAVAAGLIAIVGIPAWAGFDLLVDPEHANQFIAVRLAIEVPLIALWLSLFTGLGRRRPELIMLAILLLVEARSRTCSRSWTRPTRRTRSASRWPSTAAPSS